MSKQFRPLKAPSAGIPDDFIPKLRWPMLGSPKLDGLRVLNRDGARTSSLKPVSNRHTNKLVSHPALIGFDGEVTVGAGDTPIGFRKATSAVMAEHGEYDIIWHVFDIHDTPDVPYANRLTALVERIADLNDDLPYVRLVPQSLLHSVEEMYAYEKDILAAGFEGVMLRSPGGHYKYDRSTLNEQILLKLKRGHEKRGDARIIGFLEQMQNNNPPYINERGLQQRPTNAEFMVPKGVLGSFEVIDDETGAKFSIGMGEEGVMDDAFRKWAWDSRDKLLGEYIRYVWFDYGGYDKPRFPKMVCFRSKDDMGHGTLQA